MSKLVSGDDISDFKRWQVPDVSPGIGADSGRGGNKYITAVQLEKIQKQAYEEAYARGLREGIAAGQAQIKDKARHFVGLASSLANPLKMAGETIEQELLQLCLVIARQIIRREISLDPGQIVAVIREAISALPVSTQKIQLRLHPEDARVVRMALSEESEEITWKIIEDPALSRGDCRVVTEYSQVDATLDTRLSLIAAKLTGDERKSDQDEQQ